jgi:diaminohydroxyphosphoribosylaminopyrimidine deaminase/5-amino-6-(5-phosphoribosylamino)uracil reductase
VVAPRTRDEQYMQRALFHAARGAGRTTPNPMVGAVVVSPDGVLLGQGYHPRAGDPHAESYALDAAGERARGSTMYVTLEPCCHVGRTGPCTRRIIEAGVARVVAAMPDPDARVSGRGFDELRANNVLVEVGVCAAAAAQLNRAFVTTRTLGRPLVALKAATSLDARVAARERARTVISSRESQQRSHWLRAAIDAIAVGSVTVLADNPLLTARGCYRARPLTRVVFDRGLRMPTRSRMLSTLDAGPVVIITTDVEAARSERAQRLRDAGAEILVAADLHDAVVALTGRDVSTLLVEGGPTLQRAFVEADLVDRLHLIIAPHVIGEPGVKWLDVDTLQWPLDATLTAEPRGADIWIEGDVHRHR